MCHAAVRDSGTRVALNAALVLLSAWAIAPGALAAQQLTIRTDIPSQGFLARDAAIELTFNRPLDPATESVAVFIGATDFTGLFEPTQSGLRYVPEVVPLPSGKGELVVHLIDAAGTWSEVARVALQVEGIFGFQSRDVTPRVDLSFKAQPAEGHDPESNAPQRETFTDIEGKFDLKIEQVHSGFTLGLNSLFLGFNHQEKALRFREKGKDAAKVDLSSYMLSLTSEKFDVSVGHLRTGNQRYLMSGFSARGVTLSLAPSSRIDAQVAVTNGSSIVGWDNFLGLSDSDHQMINAMVGLEAFKTAGALRVEFSYLDASKLPRNNFNQGAVNDAEESNGYGFRVQAKGLGRRLRLDAGLTRSTFDNPVDQTLNQGFDIVEVEEETKDARYMNANIDLLKGLKLGGGKTAKLSFGYKHERVDPLFKSVGASARADNIQNQYDVRADIAGVSIRANLSDAEDNLDEIASILKSNTERRGLNVGVPLPTIFRTASGKAWLPTLNYRVDRTHQFGEELPQDGGFSASHVPDQVSVNHTGSAKWRWSKVNIGYQVNLSNQDNRQEGREDADLRNLKNAFSLGINPMRSLSLTFDLGYEEADNKQRDEINNTRRFGTRINWKPIKRSTLAIQFSDTFKDDEAKTRERSDTRLDLRWSGAIPGTTRQNGQYYIRYARNVSESLDTVRDRDERRERWTLNTGFSFSFGGR
ncbi:MAG: hypothetical protein BMS9Abin29_2554 [Gemmatimonadota bacterium]|nr:MAG: hypothetical protein BMS9Abin29_2554 [Gemmatimonadota bacterium]